MSDELHYEDLGISEEAIARGGVTRKPYAGEGGEVIQGELFDKIGDRPLHDILQQREFLKGGLESINKLREMFSGPEAQEGLARARDQITVAAKDAREALSSPDLNEKLIEFRTRLQDAGAVGHAGDGGNEMGLLSLQRLGTGTGGNGHGAARGSYKPTNAAQRAKLAQQRNASKAARAMRKKNRGK